MSTSRSTAGRSVMIPSTPRSSNRCISAASSMVHTCTATPRRWQRRTRSVTTVMNERRTGTWAASEPSEESGQLEQRQLPLPGGGAQPGSEQPAQGDDVAIAERREAPAVEGAMPIDHLGQRPDPGVVLAVDVETPFGPGVEHLVQKRDRLGAVDRTSPTRPRSARKARSGDRTGAPGPRRGRP